MCLSQNTNLSGWAKRLKKRIVHFLEGLPDPAWQSGRPRDKLDTSGKGVQALLWANSVKRSPKKRAQRLIEMLKTVDGIFNQIWLGMPTLDWNWQKYDQFVVEQINVYISDEFLDGDLTPEGESVITFYATLKKARKALKLAIANKSIGELLESDKNPLIH